MQYAYELQLRQIVPNPPTNINCCPYCKRELPPDMYCRGCHPAVKEMVRNIKQIKEEPNESLGILA